MCDSTSLTVDTSEECYRAIKSLGITPEVITGSNTDVIPNGCVLLKNSSGKIIDYCFNRIWYVDHTGTWTTGRGNAYSSADPICRQGTTSLNYQLQTAN